MRRRQKGKQRHFSARHVPSHEPKPDNMTVHMVVKIGIAYANIVIIGKL